MPKKIKTRYDSVSKYTYKYCKNPITKKWEWAYWQQNGLDGAETVTFGSPRQDLLVKTSVYPLQTREEFPIERKKKGAKKHAKKRSPKSKKRTRKKVL